MPPSGGNACLYGESSTIAFLHHVEPRNQSGHSSACASKGIPFNDPFFVDDSATGPEPLGLSYENDLAVLPMRGHADKLLACYWEFVHPLFPLLQKPQFTAKYERIWLPQQNLPEVCDKIFLSNLNLVFALGCQFCSEISPAQQVSMAPQFFARSQHVLLYDIVGSASISVVQWLLLVTIYCQSTQHANRCWNSLGLAIRIAQSLGLHIELNPVAEMSQVFLETRRKIWHTCVILDRFVQIFAAPE